MTKTQYPLTDAASDLSVPLDQLRQRIGDLSACLDWVLANQATAHGRYPTALERTMQLSLPLRWLAERAQMELAGMHDQLTAIRDEVEKYPLCDGE